MIAQKAQQSATARRSHKEATKVANELRVNALGREGEEVLKKVVTRGGLAHDAQ